MGPDYSLNNPDTLTKYKTGAQISQKVLGLVTGAITSHVTFGLHADPPLLQSFA